MEKIKIFIDASPLLARFGGIPIFSKNVLQELAKKNNIELHSGIAFLSLNKHIEYHKMLKQITGNKCKYHPHFLPGRFAEKIHFLNFQSKKYDLVHFCTHTAPSYCMPSDFSNVILSVHDMFLWHDEYRSHVPDVMKIIKDKLQVQAEKARAIVTLSEFSRREINKYIGIPLDKIYAIPIAAQWGDEAFAPSDILLKNAIAPKSYFLSVSTLMPHKNYVPLFAAYKKYRQSQDYAGEKLIVVGKRHACFTEICQAMDDDPNIIHFENLPENDLRTLYENSKGFFLVSKFEGFGIPLLEAMSCKVPACYGKGSAMDEIGRDAAWGVEPNNIDEISEMFVRFSAGGKEIDQRVDEAYKISLEYSYFKTTEAYVELYRKLLSE